MLTYLAAIGLKYLGITLIVLSLAALLFDWKVNRATVILFSSMLLASTILILIIVCFGESIAQPIRR